MGPTPEGPNQSLMQELQPPSGAVGAQDQTAQYGLGDASAQPADVGKSIVAAGLATNYHEAGSGRPVVLLHGSGPGVTAWANWRRIVPLIATEFRVVAPDVVGFGFTERPRDRQYGIKVWVGHLLGFLDALGLGRVSLVGNSFGGALALAAASRHPDRIERLVLMGTPGGTFAQTPGLRSAWSYEPSLENMERMLRMFPFDKSWVTAQMVRERYETSLLHGGQEAFRKLIPPPAPEGETTWVKGVPEETLRGIEQPTLVLHGREDSVVPPECGLLIHRSVANSQLHMFGQCGHWVQLEKESAFMREVADFLREPDRAGSRV